MTQDDCFQSRFGHGRLPNTEFVASAYSKYGHAFSYCAQQAQNAPQKPGNRITITLLLCAFGLCSVDLDYITERSDIVNPCFTKNAKL